MTPAESHFRRYELVLADIVAAYPNPTTLHPTNGKSPSYVRQQIREAFEIYLRSPAITSSIPRDTAQALFNTFTFGSTSDYIYIGPRKKKQTSCNAVIAPSEAPTLSVDCANYSVASAICLLKDFDQFPAIPITLTNLHNESVMALEATYPNISLTPTADPSVFILL